MPSANSHPRLEFAEGMPRVTVALAEGRGYSGNITGAGPYPSEFDNGIMESRVT